MRDDNILYTGASSASFGTTKEAQIVATKRKEVAEEKEGKRHLLKPSGELVKGEFDKQIALLRDRRTIDLKQTPEDIKIELVARERAEQMILGVQNVVLNIMREK